MNKVYEINKPYIPTTFGQTEKIQIKVDNDIKTLSLNIPQKPTIAFQSEMWDIIDRFENNCWSQKMKGLKTGFNSIDKAFDGGLRPGFIIIGGESNIGRL